MKPTSAVAHHRRVYNAASVLLPASPLGPQAGHPGRKGSTLLKQDPTRTTLIRQRFAMEARARFKALGKAVREWLVKEDTLGLAENAAPRYQFATSTTKFSAFSDWLHRQLQTGVLGPAPTGTGWTMKYIESAYKKGQLNAYLAAKNFTDAQKEEFLSGSFNTAERLDKVQLLGTRAWEGMKGITAQVGTQLNRILAEGMVDGSSAQEIADTMVDQIDDMSENRALTIARTETIHAHAEGQLDAFADLGVDELGVQAEWSTAGDDRVCPDCEDMEGEVFSVEEARGLIPLHPNCRCSWIPHVEKPVENMVMNFDPEEPRDEHGRWTAGGGGGDASEEPEGPERLPKVRGHSSASVLRGMAAKGWTVDEMKVAMKREGVDVPEHLLARRLRSGRKGTGKMAPDHVIEGMRREHLGGKPLPTGGRFEGGKWIADSPRLPGMPEPPPPTPPVPAPGAPAPPQRQPEGPTLPGMTGGPPADWFTNVGPEIPNIHPERLAETRRAQAAGIAKDNSVYDPATGRYVEKSEGLKEKQARVDALLKSIGSEKTAVWSRTTRNGMEGILKSGRFKSQFEVGDSRGTYDPELRRDKELERFGASKDLPDPQRPIYGYLAQNEDGHAPTSGYGTIAVRFKDYVRQRTTFTVGDSLGLRSTHGAPVNRPSSIAVPTWAYTNLKEGKTDVDSASRSGMGYIEAQIWGQAKVSDIQEIVFHDIDPSDSLKQKMAAANLKWRRAAPKVWSRD